MALCVGETVCTTSSAQMANNAENALKELYPHVVVS